MNYDRIIDELQMKVGAIHRLRAELNKEEDRIQKLKVKLWQKRKSKKGTKKDA